VEKMTDQSIKKEFESALMKIKAVLNDSEKDHLEMLQSSVEVSRMAHPEATKFPNNFLTDIQKALVNKEVLELEYFSNNNELTTRQVEPIGIQFYSGSWHMIGWCRLREGYRDFRADRIASLKCMGLKFDKHNHLSLQEYLQSLVRENDDLRKAIVVFDKSIFKYRRFIYGFVAEEDLGDKIRLTFLMDNFNWLARWLLFFGDAVEIEQPADLRTEVIELVEALQNHYLTQSVTESSWSKK